MGYWRLQPGHRPSAPAGCYGGRCSRRAGPCRGLFRWYASVIGVKTAWSRGNDPGLANEARRGKTNISAKWAWGRSLKHGPFFFFRCRDQTGLTKDTPLLCNGTRRVGDVGRGRVPIAARDTGVLRRALRKDPGHEEKPVREDVVTFQEQTDRRQHLVR